MFLRFFSLLVFSKIKCPDDVVWSLFLKLKEIVEIVCSPMVNIADIPYLKTLIKFYIENRKTVFSHVPLKAKHHFLLHYPGLIFKFGPLIRVWTMLFERNTHISKMLSVVQKLY